MEKEKRKSTIAIAVSPGVPRVKQHVLLWEIQTTNNSWLTLLHAPPSGRNEPFPHFVNFLLRDEKAEGEGEGVEDGKNRKNEKVEMKHRSRCGWCWRDQINICPYIYKYRGKEIIAAPPHTHTNGALVSKEHLGPDGSQAVIYRPKSHYLFLFSMQSFRSQVYCVGAG